MPTVKQIPYFQPGNRVWVRYENMYGTVVSTDDSSIYVDFYDGGGPIACAYEQCIKQEDE